MWCPLVSERGRPGLQATVYKEGRPLNNGKRKRRNALAIRLSLQSDDRFVAVEKLLARALQPKRRSSELKDEGTTAKIKMKEEEQSDRPTVLTTGRRKSLISCCGEIPR